jgi:hypothetical protein
MSPPICLSDEQFSAIMAAARSLAPNDQDAFLVRVAEILRRCQDVGDGVVGDGDVGRAVRQCQYMYLRPHPWEKGHKRVALPGGRRKNAGGADGRADETGKRDSGN